MVGLPLLLVGLFTCFCVGVPSFSVQLLCGGSCEAVVVVEGEVGHHGSFHAKSSSGLVVVATPEAGLYWMYVGSSEWAFGVAQVEVSLKGEVSVNVNGIELQKDREGAFEWAPLGRPLLFEERPVFSVWGLISSPMVLMGGVTVGMMLVIQLLLKSMGSVEEIRRTLRGEPEEEEEEEKEAKATKQIKAKPVSSSSKKQQ